MVAGPSYCLNIALWEKSSSWHSRVSKTACCLLLRVHAEEREIVCELGIQPKWILRTCVRQSNSSDKDTWVVIGCGDFHGSLLVLGRNSVHDSNLVFSFRFIGGAHSSCPNLFHIRLQALWMPRLLSELYHYAEKTKIEPEKILTCHLKLTVG